MHQTKDKLWTKNFIILSSVNFSLTLIFFLLNVIIIGYAVDQFNASTYQGGIVSGTFIIGALIGRLFTGRIAHSIGAKRILVWGLTLFTVSSLFYFVEYSITFLILSRFIHGITMGIASTVVSTSVALTIPALRKGEGISYFSVSQALATGIGPFIGIYMVQHTSFHMIFYFCFVLGIISLVTASFANIPNLEMTENKQGNTGYKLSSFIERKAIPISIIILTVTFCFSSVLSYINLYANQVNQNDAASFFFVVYAVAVLVSRPFAGRLMDKKGANFIMYPAFIIFGSGMLLLGSSSNSVTFLLAGALIGLGFGNISSSAQTIAVNSIAPHRIGLATATFFIFFEAGSGVGPYILGLLIPATGYGTLYVILGIIVFSLSLLYYLLYGKKERAYWARMNNPT
ncbi:multidrug MFS transporter [Paenibacillus macquariensis subsp. defensor]|nr:multidrug MFS transporter [Paenibacillus macquariensis subsp. defensor]